MTDCCLSCAIIFQAVFTCIMLVLELLVEWAKFYSSNRSFVVVVLDVLVEAFCDILVLFFKEHKSLSAICL